MVTAAPQQLADRYGTSRRKRIDRRFAWITAGGLVLAGVVFLLFSGWQTSNRVSWQDINFERVDEYHGVVKFEVTAPLDESVACAVEALNTSKGTVGWNVLELPQSEVRTHTVTTTLVTTGEATAGTVRSCWVIE